MQPGTLDEATKLGFTFAKEVTTGLITLSTGLLTLSTTFGKDVLKSIPKGKEHFLNAAWVLHIVSILFGVLTLMALTGDLMPISGSRELTFGPNVRRPAAAQIFTFLLGTAFLVVAYWGRRSHAKTEFKFTRSPISPELISNLEQSAAEGWEIVSLSAAGIGNEYLVVLKRSAPS